MVSSPRNHVLSGPFAVVPRQRCEMDYPLLCRQWIHGAALGHHPRRIAQHNPVTLTDPLTDASMTLVPVYHHADVLDHGGLSGWAKQLSQRSSEDQLLVVHFDADAESWESFALELDSADALDFVEWTNISTYLDTHDPVETVEILGDVADGTGDGQSWAETLIIGSSRRF